MLYGGDQSDYRLRIWEFLGKYWKWYPSVSAALKNTALSALKFGKYDPENKKRNQSKQKSLSDAFQHS